MSSRVILKTQGHFTSGHRSSWPWPSKGKERRDNTASPPLENPQKGVAMLRMYSNVETHVMEVRAHASSDQSRWVLIAGCQLGN